MSKDEKILFMLLLCTPLLYMGCKAEPEWVNLIAQQEQEKGKRRNGKRQTLNSSGLTLPTVVQRC